MPSTTTTWCDPLPDPADVFSPNGIGRDLRAYSDRRYVIVGAGAIGGTVGGVLARAGIPTVLVARGRHAETLAADGLTLRTPDGTFHTPVTAVSGAEQLRLTSDDVLVFTTKTQQLDAALQEWVDQPVHGPDGVVGTAGDLLPVMTALNGVAAEEKALRYFRQVFGVCVWLPAVHLEPGEVIVRSWPVVGQFHIGRWPAPLRTPADGELLHEAGHERGAPRVSRCASSTTWLPGSTTSC